MRHIPLDDIHGAAEAIADLIVRTPLVPLALPDEFADAIGAPHLFLKLESLQPIGSFKLRGAYNALRQIPAAELSHGVWTVSAGNAALGVAYAARHLSVPCSVMMMDTAPAAKVDAVRRLGATIVPAAYDECWQTVETHASSRMTGRFVHPFDDDHFIAGNATVALEILEDLPDADAVVASLGGGGLIAGLVSAFDAVRPQVKVYAAEPETAAPLRRSLDLGRPCRFENWQRSFVDGAGGKSVLPSMWPLVSRVADAIVVPLADAASAMKLVATHGHLIAEGAAACAVAAALSGRVRGKIVAIVSGGNIDLSTFASLVGACA